jgi:hypothetical protein
MRLTAEEVLISAMIDILTYKPNEADGDPYQQIAVHARVAAQNALSQWKVTQYEPPSQAIRQHSQKGKSE